MQVERVSGVRVAAATPVAAVRAPARVRDAAERDASADEAMERARREDARRAVAEANLRLAEKASELTFEFNEEIGRVVVRLVDVRTREVLRQIPSEEVLAIARALQNETIAGALLRAGA